MDKMLELQRELVMAIQRYSLIEAQMSQLKQQREEIRDRVDQIMHEIGQNEMTVKLSDNEAWRIIYSDRVTRKLNEDLLLEIVGPEIFDKVFSEAKSVSMRIEKVKSVSRNKKREKPNGD